MMEQEKKELVDLTKYLLETIQNLENDFDYKHIQFQRELTELMMKHAKLMEERIEYKKKVNTLFFLFRNSIANIGVQEDYSIDTSNHQQDMFQNEEDYVNGQLKDTTGDSQTEVSEDLVNNPDIIPEEIALDE